jgi:hypothetical protein
MKKASGETGMGAHNYNPSYLGGRDRNIEPKASPSKKLSKTLSEKQTTSKKHWGCGSGDRALVRH